MRDPPRASGFTLVEVLVALVIVAFGMGAVLASLSSAADSVIRLREQTFAEWVGLNQLSLTRLQTALPSNGDTSGTVEFAANRWQWQQTVSAMDIPGLRRIVIRVRRADAAPQGKGASTQDKDKAEWLATVMGFRGDALQTPLDVIANWDGGATQNPGGAPGPGATPEPNDEPDPGNPGTVVTPPPVHRP
jgi:general secretion pathway protein I